MKLMFTRMSSRRIHYNGKIGACINISQNAYKRRQHYVNSTQDNQDVIRCVIIQDYLLMKTLMRMDIVKIKLAYIFFRIFARILFAYIKNIISE